MVKDVIHLSMLDVGNDLYTKQPRGQVKNTTGVQHTFLELEQPKTPKMCPFLVLCVVFGERRDPSLDVRVLLTRSNRPCSLRQTYHL